MRVEPIELEEMLPSSGADIDGLKNIDLIKGVNVRLDVYVGDADISVGELFDLKQNSVIALKKDVGAPVDILLNGKVIAKGELSAVDDKFGVRITHINK